jgi:hypothetical protein
MKRFLLTAPALALLTTTAAQAGNLQIQFQRGASNGQVLQELVSMRNL